SRRATKRRRRFWTSSCAMKSDTWRLAIAGSPGCARSAGSGRWPLMPSLRSAIARRSCTGRSTSKRVAPRASPTRSWRRLRLVRCDDAPGVDVHLGNAVRAWPQRVRHEALGAQAIAALGQQLAHLFDRPVLVRLIEAVAERPEVDEDAARSQDA